VRTLLFAVSLAAITLAIGFCLIQARWILQISSYMRNDISEQHRILRSYTRLAAEWQELRNRRHQLVGVASQEYHQQLDHSLRAVRDTAATLDQLMSNHSRRFRWVQISEVVNAYLSAMRTCIRLNQQIEENTWRHVREKALPIRMQSSPLPLFSDLLTDFLTSFTTSRWLYPSERHLLAADAKALYMRLSGLADNLFLASNNKASLEWTQRFVLQELAGYEGNAIPMLRQETELLWRETDSSSELFVSRSESYLASQFPVWSALLLLFTLVIVFLHHRISTHLREIKRRCTEYVPGKQFVRHPPSGIREIDDLDKGFVQIIDNFHRELQMNSRHIKAITKIWSVFNDLSRESVDARSRPSDSLENCLDRLLKLLGEEIPALSLARILRSADVGLIPLTNDFASTAFRASERFEIYTRSTGTFQRMGWDDSLSGWIAQHAAIDPWTPESGEDVYRRLAPLRQVSEFGLTPKHEQGLDGSILGIRLHSQKNGQKTGKEYGLLILYFDDKTEVLNEADWMFITIMSHQMVSVIDTAELLDISTHQRHLTSQLAIAREIQASTIPPKPPVMTGVEIDAVIRMASQVGGDYYDFIPFRDGRIGIVIADVSGKDIPAALLTMVLKTTFKALRVDVLSPAQVLVEVNRILIGIIAESYFVTMTYCVLDPAARTIRLANAGHTPVLLRTKNGGRDFVRNIEIPGYPLGVIETSFKERKLALVPGDTLLFFTDGVIDCRNEANERFGQQRLESYLAGAASFNLPARRLLSELDAFRGKLDAPDDITVVSVTFLNSETGVDDEDSEEQNEKKASEETPDALVRTKISYL